MNLSFKRSPATPDAPAPEPVTVDQLKAQYTEQHRALVAAQTERDGVDERIGDLLAEKLMGSRVPVEELEALYDQKQAVEADIERLTLTVDGLQARIALLEATEHERLAAVCKRELEALSKEAETLEGRMVKAVIALAGVYEAMHANQRRFSQAAFAYHRHAPNKGHGVRPPRRPFVIPPHYMTRPNAAGESLTQDVAEWQAEPERRAAFRAREVARDAEKQDRIRQEETERRERARREREALRAQGLIVRDAAGNPIWD